MNKNKVYTHVSLFSGAGGLDIGLEQAGFHTVWANDFNHDACETHRLWSNATVVEGDIGKVDYDIIPDCDIASFGFPCQGFSLSGPRKIDDSRNVLYRHCVKLVEKKQPKLFRLWKRRCLSRKVEQRIVHANGEQESVKDVRECLNTSKQTIVDLKKGIVVYVNDSAGKRAFAGFCVLQSARCGHFRHLQSGKVVYIRPTTVHYKKLNPEKAINQTAKPVIYRNTEDFLREKSYLENDVLMMLKCNGIEYQREKMFPWMGKKRLDFFLPGKNIAIECQGVQRFYPYGSDDKDFEARKQRDTDKYNECTSNGVQVLYYMSELIPVPDEMARKYRYVTSLDELLVILNDK